MQQQTRKKEKHWLDTISTERFECEMGWLNSRSKTEGDRAVVVLAHILWKINGKESFVTGSQSDRKLLPLEDSWRHQDSVRRRLFFVLRGRSISACHQQSSVVIVVYSEDEQWTVSCCASALSLTLCPPEDPQSVWAICQCIFPTIICLSFPFSARTEMCCQNSISSRLHNGQASPRRGHHY